MENTVAIKDELNEQAKHLSLCVSELEGDVLNGKEAVTDLSVNLKVAKKRTDNVA